MMRMDGLRITFALVVYRCTLFLRSYFWLTARMCSRSAGDLSQARAYIKHRETTFGARRVCTHLLQALLYFRFFGSCIHYIVCPTPVPSLPLARPFRLRSSPHPSTLTTVAVLSLRFVVEMKNFKIKLRKRGNIFGKSFDATTTELKLIECDSAFQDCFAKYIHALYILSL